MPPIKSKSASKMNLRDAYRLLGIQESQANLDSVNRAFQTRLADAQQRYAEQPDRLVEESDILYAAYRAAFLAQDGASEDQMLPLTISGPDSILNTFGIQDVPHQSLQVQMRSQAHYRDGELIKKETNKKQDFINKDGKREIKVWENGKLVRHTVDGKNVLK